MQDKVKDIVFDKEARVMLNKIRRIIKHYNIIKEKEGFKDEQSRFIQKTRKGGYFDA